MERRIKFFILILVTSTVIIYINNRIANYDMRFYYGKDDGILIILQSIILLSALFFSNNSTELGHEFSFRFISWTSS